jgi:hypothetical protein
MFLSNLNLTLQATLLRSASQPSEQSRALIHITATQTLLYFRFTMGRKVAWLLSDEVIGFFQLTYSFQPHTQPVAEMSARNLPGGKGGGE